MFAHLSRIAWLVALLGLAAPALHAQDQPTGPVILEVEGAIARTNGDGIMRYDREMLEALGSTEVVTETPWTEGQVAFQGVLGRALMADLGVGAEEIHATALNDYTVTIPTADLENYDAIFALRMNGKTLSIRERGPIWVIYPWSDNPSLQNEVYYSRSIWQLKALHVGPY